MATVKLALRGYSKSVELEVDEDELVEIVVDGTVVGAIDARREPHAASVGTWDDVEQQEDYRRCIEIGAALGMPDGREGPTVAQRR